jgi:hypothetical protein
MKKTAITFDSLKWTITKRKIRRYRSEVTTCMVARLPSGGRVSIHGRDMRLHARGAETAWWSSIHAGRAWETRLGSGRGRTAAEAFRCALSDARRQFPRIVERSLRRLAAIQRVGNALKRSRKTT